MIVFLVYKNRDMTEGRGPMVLETGFAKEEDANAFIDDKPGVMGRKRQWSKEKHGDWQVEPLVINESLADYENNTKEALRKSGLAKLNRAEREALGL